MAENFYQETHRILSELLSALNELNENIGSGEQAGGLSDEEIENAWEGNWEQ